MRYQEQQAKLETLISENKTFSDKIGSQEDEIKKFRRQIKNYQDQEKILQEYRERVTGLEEGIEW